MVSTLYLIEKKKNLSLRAEHFPHVQAWGTSRLPLQGSVGVQWHRAGTQPSRIPACLGGRFLSRSGTCPPGAVGGKMKKEV